MTRRTRSKDRAENDELWSEVKQTTSHRPLPARVVNSVVTNSSANGPRASDGKRFSNTTTSYDVAGISVGRSGVDGSSGHSLAGGRWVRLCRCDATTVHSSITGSNRIRLLVWVVARSRVSGADRSVATASK